MVIAICVSHPDDFVLGMGGWLAKNSENEKVIVIIFSYGETAALIKHPDIVKKEQRKYTKEAADYLGCKEIIFLNIPDLKFVKNVKDPMTEKKVSALLHTYSPSIIYTHLQDDIIPANKAVANIVVRAAKKLKLKSEIYSFHTISFFNWTQTIRPRIYSDITQTFPRKLVALRMFKYQKQYNSFIIPLVKLFNRLWGMRVGFKHAELFYKIDI